MEFNREASGMICRSTVGLCQSMSTTTAKQADRSEMNTVCPPVPSAIPSFSDAGVHLPIEEAVQVDTWRMDPHGLGRASIDVSSEENTITHVGEIPGISSESQLEYEAYDFLHGCERVTCRVPVDGT